MKKYFLFLLLPALLFVTSCSDDEPEELTCDELVTKFQSLEDRIDSSDTDCDYYTELYEVLENGKECEEVQTAVEEAGYDYNFLLSAVELSKDLCDAFSF